MSIFGNAVGAAVQTLAKITCAAAIPLSGWSEHTQRVAVPGVTQTNTVLVTPGAECFTAYIDANVRCVSQAEGVLVFACEELPLTDVTANILILTDGGDANGI